MQLHCLNMRFFGSAMRFPHVQGGFRESLTCSATQAVVVPDGVSTAEAAFGEPLAVCVHAVNRAGPLVGKKVLVTGSGPIGVLAAMAARRAGASFVAMTDLTDETLKIAREVVADETINVATEADKLAHFEADKGYFDVAFEASGNPRALGSAMAATRPRGVIVQIGIGDGLISPLNMVVTKEIDLRGTFRFDEEFAVAVDYIAKRAIDVRPLLTDTLPVQRALEAFHLAADRKKAMKVQISF
jgi:L-idonate 5-dehydrogenase